MDLSAGLRGGSARVCNSGEQARLNRAQPRLAKHQTADRYQYREVPYSNNNWNRNVNLFWGGFGMGLELVYIFIQVRIDLLVQPSTGLVLEQQ